VENLDYGLQVACFTDVLLHSSINCHQGHATEPGRLPKDVATSWSALIVQCHGFHLCASSNLWFWGPAWRDLYFKSMQPWL